MLTLGGVPAHPLVVHAVVVLLPLAAVGTLLVVARPLWRQQLGVWVLLLALAGVAAVPVATQTGEQLPHTPWAAVARWWRSTSTGPTRCSSRR